MARRMTAAERKRRWLAVAREVSALINAGGVVNDDESRAAMLALAVAFENLMTARAEQGCEDSALVLFALEAAASLKAGGIVDAAKAFDARFRGAGAKVH